MVLRQRQIFEGLVGLPTCLFHVCQVSRFLSGGSGRDFLFAVLGEFSRKLGNHKKFLVLQFYILSSAITSKLQGRLEYYLCTFLLHILLHIFI